MTEQGEIMQEKARKLVLDYIDAYKKFDNVRVPD